MLIAATTAARDVLAERLRQVIDGERSSLHDDAHRNGEMAGAASCYVMHGLAIGNNTLRGRTERLVHDLWPWASHWWKPKDRRHDLVKAAALLLAEIERLDRQAERATEV